MDTERTPTGGRWRTALRNPRVRALVMLRATLIVSTAYLLIGALGPGGMPWFLVALLAAVLASSAFVPLLPQRVLESQTFIASVILGDTAWITVALLASGRFTAEFFYLYFFVLLLAGIGENLAVVVLGVIVVAAAYVVIVVSTGESEQMMTPGGLLRVPFLFAVAIFYGYLMDRLRNEQRRAREEAEVIRRLEDHQRVLAEANAALAAEIAERRRVEAQLQHANEALQGVAEARSGFVSTVSHELRTPLTAISNASSLLSTGRAVEGLADADRRLVEMIARNAHRMKLLVSDLLDLSKAETGRLRIEAESVDVVELVRAAAAPFEQQATRVGVELEVEPAVESARVLADPRRVEQVLANLLSNAIKACGRGGRVSVEVRVEAHTVEVAVADTGVGIPDEEQVRIFEPFFQGASDPERRRQGTGLGLSISRDLVRAHGGDLEVRSRVGEGSRFAFRLVRDAPLGAEVIALEEQVSRFRQHPYFCVILVAPEIPPDEPDDGVARLEALEARMRELMPRASDVVIAQPAHGRLVLALLSTPRAGGMVVWQRLCERFAAQTVDGPGGAPFRVAVRGPAAFPEDGRFGAVLVQCAADRTGPKGVEEAS